MQQGLREQARLREGLSRKVPASTLNRQAKVIL